MKKGTALFLSAVFCLSGCSNNGTAVTETSAERETSALAATSTAAETKATTARETTEVTTTVKTTAASAEITVEPIEFTADFTEEGFSMDLSVFEKYFYGNWSCESPYWGGDTAACSLTYTEDCFNGWGSYCLGFYEDEQGGYMLSMNGGVHRLWFVPSDYIDTMYVVDDFNVYYKMYSYCEIYRADEGNSSLSRELAAGKLDSLGIIKLNELYGLDIENFRSFTDEYGTEWKYCEEVPWEENKPYYFLEALPTYDEIRFSQRYWCLGEAEETRRWIITAKKQNGEWIATDREPVFHSDDIGNYGIMPISIITLTALIL